MLKLIELGTWIPKISKDFHRDLCLEGNKET